jgi:hypothetical protein
MSSGFVSAGTNEEPVERDDAWVRAQKELEEERRKKAEAGQQKDGKSLFEVLQQNKSELESLCISLPGSPRPIVSGGAGRDTLAYGYDSWYTVRSTMSSARCWSRRNEPEPYTKDARLTCQDDLRDGQWRNKNNSRRKCD